MHKKLCARNVFIANNEIPKLGAVGIVDYSKAGLDLDLSRWTAQEALRSSSYVSKCDIWSYGILLWECATLGTDHFSQVFYHDFNIYAVIQVALHMLMSRTRT